MDKSWVERINEAEERGFFTDEDQKLIESYRTCFVGEALEARGTSWRNERRRLDDHKAENLLYLGSLAVIPICNLTASMARETEITSQIARARQLYLEINQEADRLYGPPKQANWEPEPQVNIDFKVKETVDA